ncbi:MAG: T9SS type A sorting domain-containing protein [Crocinitomicaceae bacterium]
MNNSPINSTLELYDISGKLILRRLLSEESSVINLPTVKQVYIVKLIDKNGEFLTSRKL